MADIGIIKFQLGGIQFGIHADHILEIVQFSGARKIPRPLPYVVGLTEHRKYLVTVVDFRKRLGLSPFDPVPGITMIITKISSGMIGLLVESLSHFKRISETHILPPLSIAGFPEYLLRGVLTEEDEILLIPNLEKIFSSYMRVTLLPITAAEKIAFQYRFTPGSLTRTLENTLAMQGYLDQTLVNKLPRSMSLPSVFVHKITSYYPDFMPRENPQEQSDWNKMPTQTFKAGDETYLSLSQTLLDQYPDRDSEATDDHLQERQNIDAVLQKEVDMSKEHRIEYLLHYATHYNKEIQKQQGVAKETLLSNPKLGKHLADTLHISRMRLTSYLSYYLPVELPQQEELLHQTSDRALSSGTRIPAILADNRLRELCDTLTRLDQVLQILHEERTQITRQQIRYIANQYQVSPVKIAKLLTLFPSIIFRSEPEDYEHTSDVESEYSPVKTAEQSRKNQQQNLLTQFKAKAHHFSGSSVSLWAQFLDAQHVLAENQAVRYAAAQLDTPTCRLSKFRSYYQLTINN